eukprot:403366167
MGQDKLIDLASRAGNVTSTFQNQTQLGNQKSLQSSNDSHQSIQSHIIDLDQYSALRKMISQLSWTKYRPSNDQHKDSILRGSLEHAKEQSGRDNFDLNFKVNFSSPQEDGYYGNKDKAPTSNFIEIEKKNLSEIIHIQKDLSGHKESIAKNTLEQIQETLNLKDHQNIMLQKSEGELTTTSDNLISTTLSDNPQAGKFDNIRALNQKQQDLLEPKQAFPRKYSQNVSIQQDSNPQQRSRPQRENRKKPNHFAFNYCHQCHRTECVDDLIKCKKDICGLFFCFQCMKKNQIKKAPNSPKNLIFPKSEFIKLKSQDNFVCQSCKGTCPCADCSQTSLFNDVRILQLGIQEGTQNQPKVSDQTSTNGTALSSNNNSESLLQSSAQTSKVVLQLREFRTPTIQQDQSNKSSKSERSNEASNETSTQYDNQELKQTNSNQTFNELPGMITPNLKVSIFGGMRIDDLDKMVKKDLQASQLKAASQSLNQTPQLLSKNITSINNYVSSFDASSQSQFQPKATMQGSKIQVRLFDNSKNALDTDASYISKQQSLQREAQNGQENYQQESTSKILIPANTNYFSQTPKKPEQTLEKSITLKQETEQRINTKAEDSNPSKTKSTLISITHSKKASKRPLNEVEEVKNISIELQPKMKRQRLSENDAKLQYINLPLTIKNESSQSIQYQDVEGDSNQIQCQHQEDELVQSFQDLSNEVESEEEEFQKRKSRNKKGGKYLNYDSIRRQLMIEQSNNQDQEFDPATELDIHEMFNQHKNQQKDSGVKLQASNSTDIPLSSKGFIPLSPSPFNNLQKYASQSQTQMTQPFGNIPRSNISNILHISAEKVNHLSADDTIAASTNQGGVLASMTRERQYSNQFGQSLQQTSLARLHSLPQQRQQNPASHHLQVPAQQQFVNRQPQYNTAPQFIQAFPQYSHMIQPQQQNQAIRQPQYALDPATMQLIEIQQQPLTQQQHPGLVQYQVPILQQPQILPQIQPQQQQLAYYMPQQPSGMMVVLDPNQSQMVQGGQPQQIQNAPGTLIPQQFVGMQMVGQAVPQFLPQQQTQIPQGYQMVQAIDPSQLLSQGQAYGMQQYPGQIQYAAPATSLQQVASGQQLQGLQYLQPQQQIYYQHQQ